jgi:hypothetical protein
MSKNKLTQREKNIFIIDDCQGNQAAEIIPKNTT